MVCSNLARRESDDYDFLDLTKEKPLSAEEIRLKGKFRKIVSEIISFTNIVPSQIWYEIVNSYKINLEIIWKLAKVLEDEFLVSFEASKKFKKTFKEFFWEKEKENADYFFDEAIKTVNQKVSDILDWNWDWI